VAKKATPRKTKVPAKKPDPDAWLNGGDTDDDVAASGDLIVSKQRLGQLLHINPTTLEKYFAAGAPVIAKGSRKAGWQINLGDFAQWWVRYKMDSVATTGDEGDFEFQKSRKMKADADRVEMDNAKKRGETLTIDEAVTLYRDEASIIRSQLMAIPGRAAIPCGAESSPVVIEALLQDEINIALMNISGDNREAWTGEDGPDSNDQAESA
jgi:phage terminase Nu1 subunit (DNA packaging protein)